MPSLLPTERTGLRPAGHSQESRHSGAPARVPCAHPAAQPRSRARFCSLNESLPKPADSSIKTTASHPQPPPPAWGSPGSWLPVPSPVLGTPGPGLPESRDSEGELPCRGPFPRDPSSPSAAPPCPPPTSPTLGPCQRLGAHGPQGGRGAVRSGPAHSPGPDPPPLPHARAWRKEDWGCVAPLEQKRSLWAVGCGGLSLCQGQKRPLSHPPATGGEVPEFTE